MRSGLCTSPCRWVRFQTKGSALISVSFIAKSYQLTPGKRLAGSATTGLHLAAHRYAGFVFTCPNVQVAVHISKEGWCPATKIQVHLSGRAVSSIFNTVFLVLTTFKSPSIYQKKGGALLPRSKSICRRAVSSIFNTVFLY